MNVETEKTCSNCIHYEVCALWTTTDLDEDEAYKYCFGHYRSKFSEDGMLFTREELHERDESMYQVGITQGKKIGSKETAEKFVTLADNDILVVDTQEYGEIEVVPVERLQEIAKQFGVEIKE